jgi:hypothetical protein
MKIIEIGKSKQEIALFHQVCFQVYNTEKEYIYPLVQDIENIFDAQKNPRFCKGEAIRWVLLGEDSRTPVGRIAAFYHDSNTMRKGAWGFFECLDDSNAASLLIQTAEFWLQGKGCHGAHAPVNFGSRDQFWGLWISGIRPPSYQENYHPEYYQRFFKENRYDLKFEQSTYEIDHKSAQMERFKAIAGRVMQHHTYEFRMLNFNRIGDYADDFVSVYNRAWSLHEHFEPLESSQVRQVFRKMKPAMLQELGVFAYYRGEAVGFFISILELNEIFRDFRGRWGLWQKILFLWRRKRVRTARGMVFGVVPEHQNKGVEAGMIVKSHELLTKLNRFKRMELSWIGDFNPKMISMLKSLGAQTIKRHHTYWKNFS